MPTKDDQKSPIERVEKKTRGIQRKLGGEAHTCSLGV